VTPYGHRARRVAVESAAIVPTIGRTRPGH
jgi:hypothetical protein